MLTYLVDTDLDGLADAWEIDHFGTIAGNSAADLDGDGLTPRQEFLAGTDPNDPGSTLHLEAWRTGSETQLRFAAAAGRTYTIQATDHVASESWTRVFDVPAERSPRVVSIPAPSSGPQRYYRLITPRQP